MEEHEQLNDTLNIIEGIVDDINSTCDKIEQCVDINNKEFLEAYLIKLKNILIERNYHIDIANELFKKINLDMKNEQYKEM